MACAVVVVAHAPRAQAADAVEGGSAASASSIGSGATSSVGSASQLPATSTVGSVSDVLPQSPLVGGGAPVFGNAVRLGQAANLFQTGAIPPSGVAGPAQGLSIVPSIGISEEFAAGGFNDPGVPDNDFITSVRPALRVEDDTGATRVSLNYAPSALIYARRGYEDYVAQDLNGDAVLVLQPKVLTVTARAYVSDQPTRGGYPAGGSSVLASNNRTTTESFSLGPTFQKRIIGIGTIGLSYVAGYSRQSGEAAILPQTGEPYFVPSSVFQQSENASYTSPPIDERFDDVVELSATQDSGTGVLSGAHQLYANDTIRYAFAAHSFFAVGGGYESISYGGVPPTQLRDATWNVGIHLHPEPRTELIAEYRHRDGFNSPYLRATVPLSKRTVLSASYSETLSTPLLSVGNGVANTLVNGFGQAVTPVTAAPVQLTNQALSVQDSLMRDREFSMSTTTTWTRDTLFLDLRWSQRTPVAVAAGQSSFSETASYASATFTRHLSPRLAASAYLEYGRTRSVVLNSGVQPIYVASVSASYKLSPLMTGNLQLAVGNQVIGLGAGTSAGYGQQYGLQAAITVGVERTFQ